MRGTGCLRWLGTGLLGVGLVWAGLPGGAALAAAGVPALPPARSAPASPSAQPGVKLDRDAALKRGRQLVTWFYAQQLDPVWAAFLPMARANFGGDITAFRAYRASGVKTYGRETRLLSEDVQEQDGVTYYLRTATFERGPRVEWTVAFGLDGSGRVVNFGILGGTQAAPELGAAGRSVLP
ncbi:hypothetical protein [Deinococcus aquiradiocola]|uniref:DUF3887 domain-containing protein n=1 Tax=Deinococcus aquiradiocola TaxID=393059 RepID=A0A917PG64_9DEIO|nr:hypothetical protein [Deinococcus aquiradiocola]GGJ75698.1 hypothetical protein GCM10008939_19880 [Deinococcus aquiradiocola]